MKGGSGPPLLRWVPHEQSLPPDGSGFGSGVPGLARSGHVAVALKRSSAVVVFGGLCDKKFLGDCLLLDLASNTWGPLPAPAGEDGPAPSSPLPRAFHCACTNASGHVFMFGGRSGRRRLADFWMLDSDTWHWVELPCGGEQPSPRDFASLVAFEHQLILHGGWDGNKFLSDTYILDTNSLEWRQAQASGSLPPARCGHSAVMVEKRMLVFGGRGTGGTMLGDLWALRDFGGDAPQASWTQLWLPGTAPAPRCGHAMASGGRQVLLVGGHSQGGWISRVDTYLNDCVALDRATVQWRPVPVGGGAAPAPRAYHSLTRVEQRFLCVGGFDGATTFGDAWWLMPADDPQALRHAEVERRGMLLQQASASLAVSATAGLVPRAPVLLESPLQEEQRQRDREALTTLRARLGLSPEDSEEATSSPSVPPPLWRPGDDSEGSQVRRDRLQDLGKHLCLPATAAPQLPSSASGEGREGEGAQAGHVQSTIGASSESRAALRAAARHHLTLSAPGTLTLAELGVLFDDYRCQVAVAHWRRISHRPLEIGGSLPEPGPQGSVTADASALPEWGALYHLATSKEVRMSQVPLLQAEYRRLLAANEEAVQEPQQVAASLPRPVPSASS